MSLGSNKGTYDNPYFYIGDAFDASATTKYSRIYLLKGTHSYAASRNPLTVNLRGVALTLSTLFCSSSTHPECASSSATVTVAKTSLQVSGSRTELTYTDLIFSGKVNLDNCSGTYCTYCPDVQHSPSSDLNDKGEPISNNANSCGSFSTLSFISAGALKLTRVNFSYMRQQFRALIEVTDGDIEMTDTHFDHVQTTNDSSSAVVTMGSQAKPVSGSFLYRGGSVTYMNNGYEYRNKSQFGNFAVITMVSTVEVHDVTFQWNVLYLGESDTSKTFLLGLSECPSISITKTSFLNNLVDYAMIDITTSKPASPSQADVSRYTLVLQDLTFKNSGGRVNGGLHVEYSGGRQHNILVENITVEDCASGGTFLYINFGTKLSENTDGYTVDVEGASYFVTPRILTMKSVHVLGLNASTAFISVSGIANPTLSDISIKSSGSKFAMNQEPVMKSILANPDIYMKVPSINISFSQASALMSLSSNYNLSLSRLTIDNCKADYGVELVSVPQYSCTIEDFTAESTDLKSSMLSLSGPASCKVNSIRMTSITAGSNVLSSTLNRLELTNAKFISNKAAEGVLQLCSSSITIAALTCNSNEGVTVGCLQLVLPFTDVTTISISDADISTNVGILVAPGLAITSAGRLSQVNLQVNNATFTSNIGMDGASAVRIEANVKLLPGSFIRNSSFIQNTSDSQGALTILSKEGSLAVASCTFRANYSNKGAAVYFDNDTKSNPTLSLTSSSFTENASLNSVIYASTIGTSTLTTNSCTFSNNKSTAVYIINVLWTDTGGTFLSNQAIQAPAISANTKAEVTLGGASFTSNVSSMTAGAVYVGRSASFACTSCTFEGNTAENEGGAVYIEKYSVASFNKTDFIGNSANSGAAVFMLFSYSTRFDHCNFRANSGKEFGVLTAIEASFTLQSCTLKNNTATISPGISLMLSTVEIYDTSFESQTCESSAVFLTVTTGSKANIVRSVMDNLQGKGTAIEVGLSKLTITSSTISNSYGGSYPGAVKGLVGANLTVTNSTFSNCTSDEQGSAFSIADAELSMEDSAVEMSNSRAVYMSRSSLSLTNSSFKDNSRGGLSCEDCYNSSITGSSFSNNSALKGGGLYLSSSENQRLSGQLQIANSSFMSNSASTQGGGIYWTGSQPQLTNLTYSNNSALYGPDIASFAYSMQLLTSRRLADLEVASGQSIDWSIQVALVDHYDQVISIDNSSSGAITPYTSSGVSIIGNTKVVAEQGIFTFTNLLVSTQPDSQASFYFTSDSVLLKSAVNITLKVRDCITGEALQGVNCVKCAEGFYNLEASTECLKCPTGAVCWGNSTMSPKKGYWRANNSTDKFFQCPYDLGCLGGEDDLSYTGLCESGYGGVMCQVCSSGYSKTNGEQCAKCPDEASNYVVLACIGVFSLTVAVFLVFMTIKSVYKPKSLLSIYLKILLNYVQLVLLTTTFNLDWPSQVLALFTVQQTAGGVSDNVVSLDCVVGESSYLLMLTFLSLLPIVVLFLAGIVWFALKRLRNTQNAGSKCVMTFIVLLFLIHPNLVKRNFSMFDCVEVEDGEYWLQAELSIRCWEGAHKFTVMTVSVPSIVVWCVGAPFVCLLLLVRQRTRLESVETKLKYGFLYNGFTPKAYYWEFVIMYRKIFIICCSVFLGEVVLTQALTVMIFLLLSLHFQMRYQPYNTPELNQMELRSILVSSVTIYSGLYFLANQIGEGWKLVLFCVILVVNVYFLLSWLKATSLQFIEVLYKKSRPFQDCMKYCGLKAVFDSWLTDFESDDSRDLHFIGKVVQRIGVTPLNSLASEDSYPQSLHSIRSRSSSDVAAKLEADSTRIVEDDIYINKHDEAYPVHDLGTTLVDEPNMSKFFYKSKPCESDEIYINA
jgi:predicted outer membrane repeat protein